jgi:hypothetical protein
MTIANLTVAVIGLAGAMVILWMVRRDHLHVRYAIWWVPLAAIIALLSVFPGLVDWIGGALGIKYPPFLPLLIGFVVILVKLLVADIEQSRLTVKVDRMVQRLALLEERVARDGAEHSGNPPRE